MAIGDLVGEVEPIQSLVSTDDPHGTIESWNVGAARLIAERRPTFLIEHRKLLVDKVTYWTGVQRRTVRWLIERMIARSKELELSVLDARAPEHLVEVTAFATALAMNYLTRGKFAER